MASSIRLGRSMRILFLAWLCSQVVSSFFLCLHARANNSEVKKGVASAITSNPGNALILQFPNDRSIGTLTLTTDRTKKMPARGRVVVPNKAIVKLIVNYQTGLDMSPLKQIPPYGLQSLDLHRLEITDTQLMSIKHLTGLTDIDLDETDIDDQGLDCLSEMHELCSLGLHATCVTGRGLASIVKHKALKNLNLASDNLGNITLNDLSGLQNLTALRLARSGITDRALPAIGMLAKLDFLDLECNVGVTNAALRYLTNLKHLRHLDLSETSFTMAGAKSLKSLPALRSLVYSRKNLKAEEATALKALLPQCEVLINTEYRHVNANLFAPLH